MTIHDVNPEDPESMGCDCQCEGCNAGRCHAASPANAEPSAMSASPKDKWASGDLSFKVGLPCPACGGEMVMGFYYLNPATGTHQHTHYVCLAWPHPGDRCGWHGWTVPGWDAEEDR